MGQSLIVPVNNLLEQGKLVLDLKQLINLLLIFNDGKSRLRIFGNVFYLPSGLNPNRAPTETPMVRLGSQLSIIPLRSIIPDNKHLVSRFKAEG